MTLISFHDLDRRLRSVDHPRARAALERWLFHFISQHRRFSVSDAAQLGWQFAARSGLDTVVTDGGKDWMLQPMPATIDEWSLDGRLVDPDALPLILTDAGGEETEYHSLYDTVSIDDERPDGFTHYPDSEPLPPHPEAHDYSEFSGRLEPRERVMLSHLWAIGTVVEWGTEHEGYMRWTRNGDGDRSSSSYPGVRSDEACRRWVINTDSAERDVITLVLLFLAEDAIIMILEERQGRRYEEDDPEVTHPLEIGLAVDMVQRRLDIGTVWATNRVQEYLTGDTTLPAPEDVRWWLVYEVAQLMENVLLGHGPGEVLVAGVDQRLLTRTLPFINGQLLSRWPAESAAAAAWLRTFITGNPRFSVPAAAALAWQLRERWGGEVTDVFEAEDWAPHIDLRTEDEWSVDGYIPRPGARPLVAPGSHGETVLHYLRDDVTVHHLPVALLDAASLWERNNHFHHRTPPEEAPDLESLEDVVTGYEHALLRNATGICLHVELVEPGDDLDLWGSEDETETYVPVIATAERSVMRMAMDRIVNIILAERTGVLETEDPVDGRFPVPVSLLEEEMAVYVAAQRLGLDPGPLSAEGGMIVSGEGIPPSDLVRWGLVFDAASALEDVLRGHRWGSSD